MSWPIHRPLVLFACLLALLEVVGLCFPVSNRFKSSEWRCDGLLTSDPEPRERGNRLTVDLEQCSEGLFAEFRPVRDRVRLFVSTETRSIEELWEGDRIRFVAKFRAPKAKGIGAVGTLTDPRLIVRLASEGGKTFRHSLIALRHRLVQAIDDNTSPEVAPILKAMTVGIKGEIDRELRDDFASSGLAHLLSISGLHVGLLAVIVALAVSLLLRPWPTCFLFMPRWSMVALLTLPIAWAYIVLAGAPIPAVRAGIMMTVFAAALVIGKRQDALSTLAAAAIVIMIVWPSAVGDISFQLSIIALLGMILFVPQKPLGWFRRTLFTTFAATITTMPLVAYHFHFVSPLGLITNLVAIPLAGFILMPCAAVAVILTTFDASWASLVWKMAAVPTEWLIDLAHITTLHGAAAILPWAPSLLQVVLSYLFLGTCLFGGTKKWVVRTVTALVLITSIAWPFLHARFSNDLEVVFFDVGQGDAALVRFPGGTAWMIDGGGLRGSDFDIGRFVLAPALWRLGVYRLETMVVSHPHWDHYGGLSYLAKHFSPQEVLVTGALPPEEERETWNVFLATAMESGATIRVVSADDFPIIRGGVEVKVLHPRSKDLPALDINNSSLVLSVGPVLFTGDLEEEGERMLVASGKLDQHEILKVGHHGSRTSTSEGFLRVVQPKTAVISVGEGNRYGMPSAMVLGRIENRKTNILRTDEHGAIQVKEAIRSPVLVEWLGFGRQSD